MVWLDCRARPGLLVLSWGDSSVPVVPGDSSALHLSTLSLRACSALRNHVDSSSACGLCHQLRCGPSSSNHSPFPKAQTQEDLQFLGLWVQYPRRSLGWMALVALALHLVCSGTGWALPSLL